jgi:hypothetical protein
MMVHMLDRHAPVILGPILVQGAQDSVIQYIDGINKLLREWDCFIALSLDPSVTDAATLVEPYGNHHRNASAAAGATCSVCFPGDDLEAQMMRGPKPRSSARSNALVILPTTEATRVVLTTSAIVCKRESVLISPLRRPARSDLMTSCLLFHAGLGLHAPPFDGGMVSRSAWSAYTSANEAMARSNVSLLPR